MGHAAALLYEVNLEVDTAIAADFRAWLEAHVDSLLALPGFLDARIQQVLEPAAADGTFALCVHYWLRDRAAFDAYLRDHAAAMRADGQARFGNRFRASRRVLQG